MQCDKRPAFWRVHLFRAKAEEADRAARATTDAILRKSWEEIADGWARLADQTARLSRSAILSGADIAISDSTDANESQQT